MTSIRVSSTDGTRISVDVRGTGSPIVFVHGGMDSSYSWVSVRDSLSTAHAVHLVDRRGYGASDPGRSSYTIERELEDLEAVLQLAGPSCTVVGHSYGGLIALQALALHRPAAPAKAVLYEPPLTVGGPIVGDMLGALQQAVANGQIEDMLRTFLTHVAKLPPDLAEKQAVSLRVQQMVPALLPEVAVADKIPWTPEIYSAVKTPTLLLMGDKSAPHPNQDSTVALSKIMPNSTLVRMPGHGHYAHELDPELVAEKIHEFVLHGAV